MSGSIGPKDFLTEGTNPSVKISEDLKNLIVKFMVMCGSEWNDGKTSEFYALLDEIYERARVDVEGHLKNEGYLEAAKVYLLVSIVLKENSVNVDGGEVMQILLETSISLEDQAKKVLKSAVGKRYKEAYEFSQNRQYIESTDVMNSARSLEFELQDKLNSARNDARRYQLYLFSLADSQVRLNRVKSKLVQFFRDWAPKREPAAKAEPVGAEGKEVEVSTEQVSPEKIAVRNTYERSREEGWFDWSVYIDADEATLKKIKSVTYTLHPTFPEPVRTVTNQAEHFKLSTSGWGEFQIRADILLDNDKTVTKFYWLDLGQEGKGP